MPTSSAYLDNMPKKSKIIGIFNFPVFTIQEYNRHENQNKKTFSNRTT